MWPAAMHSATAIAAPSASFYAQDFRKKSRLQRYKSIDILERRGSCFLRSSVKMWNKNRRISIFATNEEAERSFEKIVEVDKLIDMLMDSNAKELEERVLENILVFNESFWIRLAARTDACESTCDKKDYEELAGAIMSIIDYVVQKTNEKIESSTEILEAILRPLVEETEELSWPPKNPGSLILVKKEMQLREQDGQLDEGFLAEVNAQLRQAKLDGDKPGLEAMLQKVLQLYASIVLSKRTYASKGGEVLKAEIFLESIIKAPEEDWNKMLVDGLAIGKGKLSPEELYAVVKKRTERTLIRTVMSTLLYAIHETRHAFRTPYFLQFSVDLWKFSAVGRRFLPTENPCGVSQRNTNKM